MSVPVVANEVADRFHGLRRRYLLTRVAIATLVAVSTLLSLWIVLAALDYFQEWSLTTRTVAMSIGLAGVAVWLLSRVFIISKDSRQRSFAGLLERSFDGFGQRIRTVLDTVSGRVSGPEEMLTALGNQTLGRWETLAPGTLVPTRGLITSVGIGAVLAIVAAGAYFQGGDWKIAMQRSLAMNVPYTTLSVEPGNHRLLEGMPVRVSLLLSGRTQRDVMLKYRQLPIESEVVAEADQQTVVVDWTESELVATPPNESNSTPNTAMFEAGLGQAIAAIEYQFVTSIGTTDTYRIDVQPLIEAERIETLVQPPAYTKLEERSFTIRDISALEGSRVLVSVKTNHPLEKVVLEVGDKPSKLEQVSIEPGDDRTVWTFELPSSDSLHWQFSGSGVDETPMTPVEGRLRIRRDGSPKVTWRDPTDEIKVHTLAEVPMRIQVADDYGITEAGIVFQLGDDEDFVLSEWFVEDDADIASTTRLKLEEILPLESFSLTERDFVSYYAYAIDNRGDSPQRVESDVRYIDIRPLRQLYSEFDPPPANGGNPQQRLRVSLGELIRRERFLINRTRRLVRTGSSSMSVKLGTIDRMVESQSELAGLVRFLAEFLISRGNDDVEALNQAEFAMLQAADSLAAGSFDLALVQENDALLALAEARRTLDIALAKRLTPQQQRALARFNQQMRQKLRRERPKTERQIVDSLKQIAAQQNQLGQMASAIQSLKNPNGKFSQSMSGQGQGGTSGMKPTDAEQQESAAGKSGPTSDDSDTPNKESSEGEPSDAERTDDGSDKPKGAEGSNLDDPQDGESAEPTMEEQQDGLYERQVDLVERLLALEEELAQRLSESELMAGRMENAKDAFDKLATQARERQYNGYGDGSQDTAELLRELSMQLDALQAAEAVGRVSSIRDMTTSMANMENELSRKLGGGGDPSDSTADSKEMKRLASRLKARAETIEDVLKAPVEVGDVETSEVNDQLEAFVEETDFLDQLSASKETAEEIADRNESPKSSDDATEAIERAQEYAAAAMVLDELYQQLVTPRLAKLRAMEARASQLAENLKGGGNGGKPQEDIDETEAKAAMAQLKQELEKQGMKELAELLDEQEIPDEKIAKMSQNTSTTSNSKSRSPQWSPSANQTNFVRATMVVQALRERIQETILLEISADRDAAVPAEYENAVDGYFRTIAGEAPMDSVGGIE